MLDMKNDNESLLGSSKSINSSIDDNVNNGKPDHISKQEINTYDEISD